MHSDHDKFVPCEACRLYIEKLEKLVFVDPLTGLFNRRGFDEALKHELAVSQRSQQSYSFAVVRIDLDHFKKVNDTHGHPAGDEILTLFGVILRTVSRPSDYIARTGGEEFDILLPNTAQMDVEKLTDRFQKAIREHLHIVVGDTKVAVTASIGVALSRPKDDAGSIIFRVDKALYIAKESGRDCVQYAVTM